MTTTSVVAAAAASRTRAPEAADRPTALFRAAQLILPDLERGRRIDAACLRAAMEEACGRTDAEGAWDWKSAYDACEAAAVLFLRRFGGAMAVRAGAPAALVPMLAKVAKLLPTHTRRSDESETFQQFSTPLPLASVAATAAAIAPSDRVLEPSAGTGLLAIFAELAGAALVLNELAETRAGILGHLFPDVAVTSFDAAHIDDHLTADVAPTVVLMNPPFSALANVERRRTDAALRHVSSALARLTEGGRLVAITQAALRRTTRPGATTSCACGSAGRSCSRRRSMARSMPGTAPVWRPGSPSSTSVPPTIPPPSQRHPGPRPMPPRCCAGSQTLCRHGCPSLTAC
jgi:predicted RNA methylase